MRNGKGWEDGEKGDGRRGQDREKKGGRRGQDRERGVRRAGEAGRCRGEQGEPAGGGRGG